MALAIALGGLIVASTVFATPSAAIQVTQFHEGLTASSKPQYITTGPDGNMWFTDPGTNAIGRITMSGEIKEFGVHTANAGVNGIAPGPDHNIWFTERAGHKIGQITTSGQVLGEYEVTSTSTPDSITAEQGGQTMWFTDPGTNSIGRLNMSGHVEVEHPLHPGRYRGIVWGPDRKLWAAVEDEGLIARMEPSGSEATVHLKSTGDFPTNIAVGAEGYLWANELKGGAIVRINPAAISSAPEEYRQGLASVAEVADLVAGPDANIWFTELNLGRVGRITPAGAITEFPNALTEPFGIALGPDEDLWVTERAGAIARISLAGGTEPPGGGPPPPVATTGVASNISGDAATVSGTVRSRGADTHYHFEYGLTAAYGQATPLSDNGAGDNTQTVSAVLASLQPGATYHYRLIAANSGGTAYGSDLTFRTAQSPPTVTVGPFTLQAGGLVYRKYERLARIVVFGVHAGEQVSYVCKRCHGSPARASRRAVSSKVTFAARGLIVTAQSLMQIAVVDSNGSRRVRTYGFRIAGLNTEPILRGEQCFLPGGGSPVSCPGTSHRGPTRGTPRNGHKGHKRNAARRKRKARH